MEFNVLIGGEAGQGAFSVELELTEILTRLNFCFFATKNYMSRVRGGHNFHMIRIADHPVHALKGGKWDMVIALDDEAVARHKPNLRDEGIYISPETAREIEKEARDTFRNIRAANSILVGIVLSIIGATADRLEEAGISDNLEYLKAGIEKGLRWKPAGRAPLAPKAANPCKLDGNQAIAIGALLGGCQFMAGYPMTPATSIMHYFAEAAQGLPVHFEQAEDEIAAINMALGASYAGVRAMTATSGGGFALMQEGVSLAGMTETPIVIVVSQRPGPATGLPTRTEQGDLDFVVHAGHGEFARIVFAPGSIDEAIDLTAKSFDLADQYQIPVFLLTDQYLADSVQLLETALSASIRQRDYPLFDESYRRYALTENGISPLTYPGLSEALVKVDSDEHDEEGKITEDLALRSKMVQKRLGKMAILKKHAALPTFYGDADADTVLVCWGSNKLIVKEAAEKLAGERIHTAVLHFGQVYPLTPAMIAPYHLGNRALICIENNAQGQFSRLLLRELGLHVSHQILKYNGESFTVEELYQHIKNIPHPRSSK
jgi:2-oxoglutarate ferredoxin oxidoreductase subunit alpha